MPRVIREPSLTEKTQTWVEIRKAVPVMKHVGVNPGEVNGGSHIKHNIVNTAFLTFEDYRVSTLKIPWLT